MFEAAERVETSVLAGGRREARRVDRGESRDLEVGGELRQRKSWGLRRCVYEGAFRNEDGRWDVDRLMDTDGFVDI